MHTTIKSTQITRKANQSRLVRNMFEFENSQTHQMNRDCATPAPFAHSLNPVDESLEDKLVWAQAEGKLFELENGKLIIDNDHLKGEVSELIQTNAEITSAYQRLNAHNGQLTTDNDCLRKEKALLEKNLETEEEDAQACFDANEILAFDLAKSESSIEISNKKQNELAERNRQLEIKYEQLEGKYRLLMSLYSAQHTVPTTNTPRLVLSDLISSDENEQESNKM